MLPGEWQRVDAGRRIMYTGDGGCVCILFVNGRDVYAFKAFACAFVCAFGD